MIKIELSTMCLKEKNNKEKILNCKKLVEKAGLKFGIQLHNSIDEKLYNELMTYKNEIEFTVHSPIFTKYLLNLASSNFNIIKNTSDENIKFLKKFNTNIFFFHGFSMTDKNIPNDIKNYRKIMLENIPSKYRLDNSILMNSKFFNTDEFAYYKQNFKQNYNKLKKLYPDFIIALENDYPGMGSGLQRPEEIFELVENLWLDVGHLWCSSILHKFNFYEKIFEIIEKKYIVGVHLNHNLTKQSDDISKIHDSHTHLYEKSEQNIKRIVKKLLEKKIKIFTLEIINGDIEDVKILLNWIQ